MMTEEQQIEAMVKVQDAAASLGLHGILVLSPPCAKCGALHQFHVMADVGDGEARDILAYWAQQVSQTDGLIVKERSPE